MKRPVLVALLLALLTATLLSLGHRSVGYVRDEGIYFAASRHHAAWAARLLTEPATALSARERDRAFTVNHEHPALLKVVAGVSARLFAEPGPTDIKDHAPAGLVPLMPEGAAMRLPAQLLAALAVALLFLAGSGLSADPKTRPLAGLCAALWFIALPHVWFHAGLHCFDVPVAALTLAVVLIYRRALASARWAIALGPALGVAISIKHNALFIPILLGVHYLACLALARRRPTLGQLLPLPFVSMALLAPLTVLALWPWLWTDPVGRLQEYIEFHRLHAYYNTEYFNINYNRPPLPTSYPFVLTWATVPTGALLLALLGLVTALRRDLSEKPAASPASWTAPLLNQPIRDGLLYTLFAAFPLLLIAQPWVPIFGGTKHWLTAYPFLALAAAAGFVALSNALETTRWSRVPIIVLALVLVPGVWSTVDGHPHGLAQYAPMIGGPRGAADNGMLRNFWGHSLPPSLLRRDSETGPIYLHDLHELARLQYEREGRWPADAVPASVGRARTGLLFHERHMLTHDIDLWQRFGPAPAEVVTLDDVPLTSVYRDAGGRGR